MLYWWKDINTCYWKHMWILFPMSLSVNALASLVATWFLNVNSVKIQHLHLFFLVVKTGFYHATMSSLVYGHLVLRVADSHHPLGNKPKKLKTLSCAKAVFFSLQKKKKRNFTILKSKLQFNANSAIVQKHFGHSDC